MSDGVTLVNSFGHTTINAAGKRIIGKSGDPCCCGSGGCGCPGSVPATVLVTFSDIVPYINPCLECGVPGIDEHFGYVVFAGNASFCLVNDPGSCNYSWTGIINTIDLSGLVPPVPCGAGFDVLSFTTTIQLTWDGTNWLLTAIDDRFIDRDYGVYWFRNDNAPIICDTDGIVVNSVTVGSCHFDVNTLLYLAINGSATISWGGCDPSREFDDSFSYDFD